MGPADEKLAEIIFTDLEVKKKRKIMSKIVFIRGREREKERERERERERE